MTFSAGLSEAARSVWAKSVAEPHGSDNIVEWLPLFQHLDDTAGVGAKLWDEWVAPSVKALVSADVGDRDAARSLYLWLCAVHDVGKASPAFAIKVAPLAQVMINNGLAIDQWIKGQDQLAKTRHELVGYLAVSERLTKHHGFSLQQARAVASIVAAHHGKPTGVEGITGAAGQTSFVGAGSWNTVRQELLVAAERQFVPPEHVAVWREAQLSQPSLMVLSAMVIVADWLASSDYFERCDVGVYPAEPTANRVAAAWEALEFPSPWNAQPASTDPGELLRRRFRLPDGAVPHPAQVEFVRAAQSLAEPELMILEAEMGSGKTEAALLAAEILASRFGLSGVFFGLPTQATADALLPRLTNWIAQLELDAPADVQLLHSKAAFNRHFEQMARFSGVYDDTEKSTLSLSYAHNWFSQPRRGPLAHFAIGTVDQALAAGLRTLLVMLRHLALASKVVVIDEVHAYDAYMSVYLERTLRWLGAYGAPVIMLSATLPAETREKFVRAYADGRANRAAEADLSLLGRSERKALRAQQAAQRALSKVDPGLMYPRITISQGAGTAVTSNPGASNRHARVEVAIVGDDRAAEIARIRDAVGAGANVAVIRNTVRRAQEAAAELRAQLDDPDCVTLVHSRFVVADREAKNSWLLQNLGSGPHRSRGQVVVATQVIEQSLDVDFDLMFSDVAPIDLLFQRVGRLHRHAREHRPTGCEVPRLVLTGVDLEPEVPSFPGGSEYVYTRALLLRTMAALRGRNALAVPEHIPLLVEQVYGGESDAIPETWRSELHKEDAKRRKALRDRRGSAEAHALEEPKSHDASLIGVLDVAGDDSERARRGRVSVRDGQEALEVILLIDQGDFSYSPLPLGNGGPLPMNAAPSRADERRVLASMVRLPPVLCHPMVIDDTIKELEKRSEMFWWDASPALRGELYVVLDTSGRTTINGQRFRYSAADGLVHETTE